MKLVGTPENNNPTLLQGGFVSGMFSMEEYFQRGIIILYTVH